MIENTAILKRLAGIKEIPTLPEVMREVLAALGSERSSAEDLARIISKDQALYSKVLKIANSAFFAQSRRISDIGSAVVLLGLDAIAQLTLATAVFKAFDTLRAAERFDVYGFWKHSIATAIASSMIAESAGKEAEAKTLYTAGLLHDIGKLVLVSCFPGDYAPVLEKLRYEETFVYEAELQVLGFTHCDIGEWLCNRWNFPEDLVNPIAHHHDLSSSEVPTHPGACIVRLANTLCNRMLIGNSGNTRSYSNHTQDHSALELREKALDKVEKRLEGRVQEIEFILTTIR